MIKKKLCFLLRVYTALVSPFLSTSCKFYPTCSKYFFLVLNKYNFFLSLFFILKRLLKCYFFYGGYDPAP